MGKSIANCGNCGLMGWRAKCVVFLICTVLLVFIYFQKNKNKTKNKTNKQYHFFSQQILVVVMMVAF